MSPIVIGELVNGAISSLIGVYIALLGFRVIGKRPGENVKVDDWHRSYGRFFRIVGPILIAFGLLYAAIGVLMNS